jgi:hypothetical protein
MERFCAEPVQIVFEASPLTSRLMNVLALGLDPAVVDLSASPGLTTELVRAFIGAQLDRVRELGHAVESCLVDGGDTAESVLSARLDAQHFDVVVIGAGLRAPERLLLFERLLNLVHERAPQARICFNTTPADTSEAVERWARPAPLR